MRRATSVASVTLVLALAGPQLQAADALYFTSSPSSWIGQGQKVNLTSPTTTFTAFRYFDQGAYTNAVSLSAGGYSFTFVAPNYSLPTVGSYPNATRWPFMGSGTGMALTAPGRANNTLTGHFEVYQAEYDSTGNILAMAVNFTQYDEGNPNWWNTGAWRYHSTVPVPEPASALVALAAFALLNTNRRRPLSL